MTANNSTHRGAFEYNLATEELWSMATELQMLREHPPLTKRTDGRYEGNILSFVKGLRISARLIYFLRNCLSEEECEVSWGHILDSSGQSCSPECDVIIHQKGQIKQWNGSGPNNCVMDFKFIRASRVRAVVSCKSVVTSIDEGYPEQLEKFGVSDVFLFGECCSKTNYANLKHRAQDAGYINLFCAYFTESDSPSPVRDEQHHFEFYDRIRELYS